MSNSSPGRLESVPCNLCGSRDLSPVYCMPDTLFHPNEWFSVVECTTCGLGFVNPRPVPSAIGYYEAWQRATGTYGITTYVARKPALP